MQLYSKARKMHIFFFVSEKVLQNFTQFYVALGINVLDILSIFQELSTTAYITPF